MEARDTWNTLSSFPLTSVQRMIHRSIIVLKGTRLTTKCLNTTGINSRLKCQYILRINIHINWYKSSNRIVRNTASEHDSSPLLLGLPVFRGLPLRGQFSRSLLQFVRSEVVKCKIDLPLTNPLCNFEKKSFVRSIVIYFCSTFSLHEPDTTFTVLVCLKYHN